VSRTYDVVKNAFTSSKKSSVVNATIKSGQDFYSKKTTVLSFTGVDLAKAASFGEYVVRILKVPDDKKNAFLANLDFSQEQNLRDSVLFYKSGVSGPVKSVHIVSNANFEKKNFNVFILETTTDFKVTEDLFVLKNSVSKVGGFLQAEKIDFKKLPKSMTVDDVSQLIQFLELAALNKFKAYLDTYASKLA
jgi:hypothetical protein